ncbi:hypothetical protein EDD37DRAFT_642235 [Exophiala viscosa]|uniref:uncharacterized protein n=1 Tax=Exophiala viscosa TaxID=2486360 RepID=UPI0021973658|nr:hypothetical protein EDD37DRAFT_642235 [Exophiala viscosa]
MKAPAGPLSITLCTAQQAAYIYSALPTSRVWQWETSPNRNAFPVYRQSTEAKLKLGYCLRNAGYHKPRSETTSVTTSLTPDRSTVGSMSTVGSILMLSAPGLLQLVGLNDEPMQSSSERAFISGSGSGSAALMAMVGSMSRDGSTLTLSAPGLLQFVGLKDEPRQRSPPTSGTGRARIVLDAKKTRRRLLKCILKGRCVKPLCVTLGECRASDWV